MNWFTSALRELFSLFVDDVHFTVAILLWVIFVATAAQHLALVTAWGGPLLFAGCAVILIISTWRASRL